MDLIPAIKSAQALGVEIELLHIACQGSQHESADESDRLADLSILSSDHRNVSLARVSLEQSPIEDAARITNGWLAASAAGIQGSAILVIDGSGQRTPIRTHALTTPSNNVASATPELLQSCKCHGMLVATPPRCQINGRKPALVPVAGYRVGESGVAATDHGPKTPVVYNVFATIPASTFDCCFVLGSPCALLPDPSEEQSAQVLGALTEQLIAKEQCLLLRRSDRYGATVHIAAPPCNGATGQLVCVRVATREDVLAPPTMDEDVQVDSQLRARIATALQALPQPSCYNPFAYSTGWADCFSRALLASEERLSAATATASTTSSSTRTLIKSVLM